MLNVTKGGFAGHHPVAVLAALLCGFAAPAHAGIIGNGAAIVPAISAGSPSGVPPDSPGARVDPNLPTSPYSGVVSVYVRSNGQDVICSGTLVNRRDIVTAGHCVDSSGNGTAVNPSAPGTIVQAVFNSSGAYTATINASSVLIHPDYQGFGVCPPGVNSQCFNDDIAVIHLQEDAPASARSYAILGSDVAQGQVVRLGGYGASGDGVNGYQGLADFAVKRAGGNVMDLFERDDEQDFTGGPQEVWYADFDGGGKDTFCELFGVCTPVLANDEETIISGGDTGGPAFIVRNGQYILAGSTSFYTDSVPGITDTPGTFGNYFGGVLTGAYVDFLRGATNGNITVVGVPEPGSVAVLLAGLGLMGVARRRRA